jgi:hypothetical protein
LDNGHGFKFYLDGFVYTSNIFLSDETDFRIERIRVADVTLAISWRADAHGTVKRSAFLST